jgi:hypothetical protein
MKRRLSIFDTANGPEPNRFHTGLAIALALEKAPSNQPYGLLKKLLDDRTWCP